MRKLLIASVAAFGFLTVTAQAYHSRHIRPEAHPNHARCVRGPYNNPYCRHLHHLGDSSHYYQHHDRSRHHGMALD